MPIINVHKYEDTEETISSIGRPIIFLAGPTVRPHQSHLISWRYEAINEFKNQNFYGDLIVPEFTTKENLDDKSWVPSWEFNGLKKAHCIMFWIPRTIDLIALTTNMEFGYWQGREPNKMIYGRPNNAYKIGYLDTMWKLVAKETEMYEPLIYTTLETTITAAIEKANLNFQNK